MHDKMTKIGEIIRRARESKKMTQLSLAKETDTVVRTIMDIENEKRYPTYEVLFKILHALDLSADHIFWPERTSCTPEQDQLLKALQSCNEREKAVFMGIAWAYIQGIKDGEDIK